MSTASEKTARALHDALDSVGENAMLRDIADDLECDGYFGPATTRAAWLADHGPPKDREFFRRLAGSLRKACTLDP